MTRPFANLHNHTNNGSYDSIMTPSRFVARLKELGQEHLVQTDHGTMRGMVETSLAAQKAGLKYIPGLEAYVTYGPCEKAKDEFGKAYYHMLLIAKNDTGLKNLYRLVYLSHTAERYYYKPRISLDDLFNHKEGLIITSGCLGSLTSRTIMTEAGGLDSLRCTERHVLGHRHLCDDSCDVPIDAPINENLFGARSVNSLVGKFLDNFGDDFYLELQDSGAGPEQDLVNDVLIGISKEKGIPLVATSDAHYATPGESQLKTMVMKVRHGSDSPYGDVRGHLKSGDELALLFGNEPIANTIDLVNKCNVNLLYNQTYFPAPALPEDTSSKAFLRKLSKELLSKKGFAEKKDYVERMESELDTICDLGFADYFLVMYDIMMEARSVGITFSPGRGSSAGSLVCMLLDITTVDPIEYGLYFSRFLNKARVSFPDIDVDVPTYKREELLRLITKMYGNERVCQIMTFSAMKPKGTARDVGRILSEPKLGEEVSELIPPALHGVEVTVSEAIKQEPKLRESRYAPIIDRMKVLEGLNRSTGIHAAGVVISPVDLFDLIPCELQGKDRDKTVAQLSMDEVEKAGFVKMDFLGLRTLEVIDRCISLVPSLDSTGDIPDHDEATFRELRETDEYGGIFQIEGSQGMADLVKAIQVNSISDISDGVALYRPGPLGTGIDKLYIKNRRARSFDSQGVLGEITKTTHGCLIYQEQLIRLCVEVAGMSPEDGDRVRKVLGKKKIEEVEKWKEPFVSGAIKTSKISEKEALDLFENIQTGSSYLFNLAHSVAYSYLSYWCAYLRHHHRSEFFASLINASINNKVKLLQAIKTCNSLGVEILPPQIHNLQEECIPLGDSRIQMGISSCKYLKKGSVSVINASKKQPKTILDFFSLVNKSKFNSGKAAALAKGGILDEYANQEGISRTALIAAIPDLYAHFKKVQDKFAQRAKWEARYARRMEQNALKLEGKPYGVRLVSISKEPEIPPAFDFSLYQEIPPDRFQMAIDEYEIMGICLDAFPTDFMNVSSATEDMEVARKRGSIELEQVGGFSWKKKIKVTVSGVVTAFKEQKTKKGKVMASLNLEDHSGLASVMIYAAQYGKRREKIPDNTCIEARCFVKEATDLTLQLVLESYRILKPIEVKTTKLRVHTLDEFKEALQNEDLALIKFLDVTITRERNAFKE